MASADDPLGGAATLTNSISATDQTRTSSERSGDDSVATATGDRPTSKDPITAAIETIKQMDPETLANLARAFIKPAQATG